MESEGDPFWNSVERRAQLRLAFSFCTLRTNEILRTVTLVQVDKVRVVDLDIGASKSDICAIRVVTIFGARRQNSSLQPRVGVGTAPENVESTGRPATNR